jgi:predicted transcriptional regulator with HTH domain
MKYALILIFSLLHFSIAAQTSKVAVRYSSDSSIVGTGLVEKNLPNGLWKFYTTKTFCNPIHPHTYNLNYV